MLKLSQALTAVPEIAFCFSKTIVGISSAHLLCSRHQVLLLCC